MNGFNGNTNNIQQSNLFILGNQMIDHWYHNSMSLLHTLSKVKRSEILNTIPISCLLQINIIYKKNKRVGELNWVKGVPNDLGMFEFLTKPCPMLES